MILFSCDSRSESHAEAHATSRLPIPSSWAGGAPSPQPLDPSPHYSWGFRREGAEMCVSLVI
jgi:hypothetical protein